MENKLFHVHGKNLSKKMLAECRKQSMSAGWRADGRSVWACVVGGRVRVGFLPNVCLRLSSTSFYLDDEKAYFP